MLIEILEVFNDLVCMGKVCYIGVFNEMLWGVMSYLCFVEKYELLRIVLI